MATSQFTQFLHDATSPTAALDPSIDRDCLYGVYTSWCFLARRQPAAESVFWAAMRKKKIVPGRTRLRIKGPAAADYLVCAYTGSVWGP
ncbi:hypothetical protein [Arthrobacter sp. Soil763]|uniref:hypothetical protein n=1 Tax=Arthrobacter sp. Soil763 TaxID=1736402 RepID=UPI0006F4275E|nr:hypothetical protein [Arthrobacter sp. Soil763]KRE79447.1 hypothetical protein ASG71_05040 [Arthrobacter sp. Soil763]